MPDPSQHPAHEFPLADRIVDGLIGDYIVTACELALAAHGYSGDKAAGYVQAVEDLRYRNLAGWDYRLTPKILDALRRAGLLVCGENAAGLPTEGTDAR